MRLVRESFPTLDEFEQFFPLRRRVSWNRESLTQRNFSTQTHKINTLRLGNHLILVFDPKTSETSLFQNNYQNSVWLNVQL